MSDQLSPAYAHRMPIPLSRHMQSTGLPSTLLQLLVREPLAVMQSFAKVLQPTLQELGYAVRTPVRQSLCMCCACAAKLRSSCAAD
jgi:hypothetical protein